MTAISAGLLKDVFNGRKYIILALQITPAFRLEKLIERQVRFYGGKIKTSQGLHLPILFSVLYYHGLFINQQLYGGNIYDDIYGAFIVARRIFMKKSFKFNLVFIDN